MAHKVYRALICKRLGTCIQQFAMMEFLIFMIRFLIRVIFVAIPAVALAQGGPGSIAGRVSDSQQLALSRAVIELEDSEGHIVQKVVADETGYYKIESVPPASYTVSFTAV